MSQNEESVRALSRYRLEQARETLEESQILYENGNYRGAANRAYYVCFYAVLALLVEKSIGTSKHVGVISLFDKLFVKTGIFAKKYSKIIHAAFDLRQDFDYAEFVDVDKDEVTDGVAQAEDFLSAILKYFD